jgi:hypothetical protein
MVRRLLFTDPPLVRPPRIVIAPGVTPLSAPSEALSASAMLIVTNLAVNAWKTLFGLLQRVFHFKEGRG